MLLAAALTSQLTSPVPELDEICRASILEILKFAEVRILQTEFRESCLQLILQLGNHEFHTVYSRLTHIPLHTLNLCHTLYWVKFSPHLPFLHLATYRPRRIAGFLLAMLISIGSVYSGISGSNQLACVLAEIVHRSLVRLVMGDNRMARSISVQQTFMLWGTLRYAAQLFSVSSSHVS